MTTTKLEQQPKRPFGSIKWLLQPTPGRLSIREFHDLLHRAERLPAGVQSGGRLHPIRGVELHEGVARLLMGEDSVMTADAILELTKNASDVVVGYTSDKEKIARCIARAAN
jgi:hypothetical protein